MSKFRILNNIAGIQHIDQTFPCDTTLRMPNQGAVVVAVDPYWGGGEFQYVYFNGTVREKGLVSIKPAFDATNLRWRWEATELANTANLGSQVGVAVMPAIATQYGWVQIGGLTPVNCNASIAADTSFGVVAAGQGGAVAAGKQILNARIHGAATITSVKAAIDGVSGATTFRVSNTDGWFVGGYVSGTGVGASAKVTAIDTAEQLVTVNVANSANVTGNVTFTYNNATVFFNVALLNRPFAQGAIT